MVRFPSKTVLKKTILSFVLLGLISALGVANAQQTTNPENSELSKNLPVTATSFITSDKLNVLTLWAESLKYRNGAFRFAMLSNQLKAQEYKKYRDLSWIIGGSSPKVVSYKFKEVKKIDAQTFEYTIEYQMTDSTKTLYQCHENLTIQQYGDYWFVIKHDNYDCLPTPIVEVK